MREDASILIAFVSTLRWWLDLNTPACVTNVQDVMKKRIELAKVAS